MQGSKIILEVLEENELARLGISCRSYMKGRNADSILAEEAVRQSQTSMASHKLFCLLRESKKAPRNPLSIKGRLKG